MKAILNRLERLRRKIAPPAVKIERTDDGYIQIWWRGTLVKELRADLWDGI